LEIRAEIPGFKAEELKVFVEPNRLTISGETEKSSEEKTDNTLYSEWRSQKAFRTLDLPREVKTDDAKATLKDGILSLTLAKAEETEPQKVEINNG
jgi:HSP20 family protein